MIQRYKWPILPAGSGPVEDAEGDVCFYADYLAALAEKIKSAQISSLDEQIALHHRWQNRISDAFKQIAALEAAVKEKDKEIIDNRATLIKQLRLGGEQIAALEADLRCANGGIGTLDELIERKDKIIERQAEQIAKLKAAVKEKDAEIAKLIKMDEERLATIVAYHGIVDGLKEQIDGMQENKRYREDDLALNMEEIARLRKAHKEVIAECNPKQAIIKEKEYLESLGDDFQEVLNKVPYESGHVVDNIAKRMEGKMIQRYSVDHKPHKDEEGDWSLYADHLAAVKEKDAILSRLRNDLCDRTIAWENACRMLKERQERIAELSTENLNLYEASRKTIDRLSR